MVEVTAAPMSYALDDDIIRALAWCRLGSSAGHGYPDDGGFGRAKALGLLAHDPIWRATPQGEGVLIALGLLDSVQIETTATVTRRGRV